MKAILENLKTIVGRDSVLTERDELLVYECDGLPYHKYPPLAVVFPNSTEEVSKVVKVLNNGKVSFSPRGAGTGLSGGALSINNGVVIELGRMKRILSLDIENRLATVETGLVNAHLSRAVTKYGLHYAPDPSSQMTCTIGGNIAENAGGIHCLKYGVTTDHVVCVRAVLSDGSVVDFNLNDSGYDLLGLYVGSEGTFGLATEATLKLTFNPPSIKTILAEFSSIDAASHAVSAIIAEGIIPAALEMVDGETIRAVEASVFAAGLSLDANAALLIELDGLEAGLNEEAEKAESICRQYGAGSVRQAKDEYERKKLWAARKSAIGALGRVTPDLMLQDAVVPRSRLPEVLAETYRVGAKYNLRVANVFHAGDGNLHPILCFDSRHENEVLKIKEAGREIMQKCVEVGGTITGEHGVGLDKSDYLPLIFNDDDMETMLRVRTAFDPTGLCNPGKIFPILRGCGEKRALLRAGDREKGRQGEGETGRRGEGEKIFVAHEFALRTRVPRVEFVIDDAVKNFASLVGDKNVSVRGNESVLVAPASIEEAGRCLKLASSNCWSVVPVGRQTSQKNINGEIIITTERMNRVISHEPADLVATVEAGCLLSDFQHELSQRGQWLPVDPPDDGKATIGGVIAMGGGGPLSFGFGKPRSHILGMRVVLADGKIIKAGGRVVKNVAGYDLCKLFTGSRGTLGLILEATFKLKPLPERITTLVVFSSDVNSLFSKARRVIAKPLLPSAIELFSTNSIIEKDNKFVLLIRFMGHGVTVQYQIEESKGLFENCEIETIEDDIKLWQSVSSLTYNHKDNAVCNVSVLPSQVELFLKTIDEKISLKNSIWQAGVGDGRVQMTADNNWLSVLREEIAVLDGSLRVENTDEKIAHDFGNEHKLDLMKRIKEQLDPQNLFGRRYVFE